MPAKTSKYDGTEPGGYVVVNVDNPTAESSLIVWETAGGQTTFATLSDARTACRELREESGNTAIYVYALVGVGEAKERHPDVFV